MKLRISNQLNMTGTCLTTSRDPKYFSVWNGKSPVAFTNLLAAVQTGFTALSAKASEAESANGGSADAKAATEATLEDQAHTLARALTVYFKSINDLTRLGQVNLSRTDIVRLRENDLVAKTVLIRDIAAVAMNEPTAGDNGITAQRVETLSATIQAFETVLAQPRGKIVSRKTLLKELDTDMAAILSKLRDLDDLVLQFSETPAGCSFIEAWHNARIVIDRAGEIAKPTPAPAPAPTTAN